MASAFLKKICCVGHTMDEREERVQDEVETSWLISAATPLYGATDQIGLLPSANFDTHDDVARNQSFIYSRGKSIDERPPFVNGVTYDPKGFVDKCQPCPTVDLSQKLTLTTPVGSRGSLWEMREVVATPKLTKQPCQKPSLLTVVAFRPGNSRAGETRSSFPKLTWCLDDPRLRTTLICQDFCLKNSHRAPTMPVTCRRFVPGPSDVLVEPYKASDGEIVFIMSPPYACVDIDSPNMRGALEAYIKECRPFISKDILATLDDDIYKLGLLEAERFITKRKESIVSLALEILACVHVNFKQAIMLGMDTLDVSPVLNDKLSIHGTSPVPTVLDYQIDTLYIYHMQSRIKEVCEGLKKLIFTSNNTSNWYEIFLTIFVLLVSLEQVYMAQVQYIQLNPKKLSYVSQFMISEWRDSAKNLLYHFRCVVKGMIPFSPSWDPNKQNQVELDQESLAYIQTMSKILDERKAELSNLREGLDNIQARPLTWLVELFIDD